MEKNHSEKANKTARETEGETERGRKREKEEKSADIERDRQIESRERERGRVGGHEIEINKIKMLRKATLKKLQRIQ